MQLSLDSLFENQQSSFTLVPIYFQMCILGNFLMGENAHWSSLLVS